MFFFALWFDLCGKAVILIIIAYSRIFKKQRNHRFNEDNLRLVILKTYVNVIDFLIHL